MVCRIPGSFGDLLDFDAEQSEPARSRLKRKRSQLIRWCSKCSYCWPTIELELWLLEPPLPAMMMVVVSFHLRGSFAASFGPARTCCGGLNVAIELRERALCLSQIAGRKRLAKRIQIVRNRVVIVGGSRGGGRARCPALRLERLLQGGECRLRARQVAD